MNRYTFDSKERKAEIVKDSKPYFSFKLEDYNPQALSHCYAVVSVYAHTDTPYGDVLSDMKFRNIHKSDVQVKNLKIERWESEDYEVTEREYEDYKHEITKEEWGEEEKMSGKDTEMMLGGKVGDTVTRQRVSKEWQETRTKWLWKEYDPRTSKGLIPQGETVKLRISFDKPFDFYNQAESSVDWIPVVTKDTEIKELAWFNSSWSYRRKFTSDNTKVAASYPHAMILDLSQFPADFFTKIKSGGEDIRITKSDGTTELARGVREVVTTVDSEAGLVYFHADGISTSADTDFYIYYGNSGASDYADDNAKGMENVFSSDYKFYSPMADLTTSSIKDETSNDNDGTKKAANEPEETAGKLGKAQDFDGSNDYVGLGTLGSLGSDWGKGSIAFWFKSTSKTFDYLFGIFNNTGNVGFQIYVNTSEEIGMYIRDDSNVGLTIRSDESVDIRDGNWHHVLLNWDGPNNEGFFCIDGQLVDGAHNTNTPSNFVDFQHNVPIGARNVRGSIGGYAEGSLDEFFFCTGYNFTTNEITTIYNNQSSNSTFWSVGSEETDSASETSTHTVDTLLLKTSTEEHTVDTNVLKRATETHSVDTLTGRKTVNLTATQEDNEIKLTWTYDY